MLRLQARETALRKQQLGCSSDRTTERLMHQLPPSIFRRLLCRVRSPATGPQSHRWICLCLPLFVHLSLSLSVSRLLSCPALACLRTPPPPPPPPASPKCESWLSLAEQRVCCSLARSRSHTGIAGHRDATHRRIMQECLSLLCASLCAPPPPLPLFARLLSAPPPGMPFAIA